MTFDEYLFALLVLIAGCIVLGVVLVRIAER